MKKMILWLWILCLLFFISACTKSAEPTATPQVTPSVAPSPSAPPEPTLSMDAADFPRIDGSTANIPLGQALYSRITGKTAEEAAEAVNFSGTADAWRKLQHSETDLLLVYEASEETKTGLVLGSLEIAPIGKDALVFLVNEKNTINSLTPEQIQQIYTGETTNWRALGGDDRPITAYQRNETSGSQAMMRKLVMPGVPIMDPPTGAVIGAMGELVEAVAHYANNDSGIGYNVYYYVTQMKSDPNIKILDVNGVPPENASIQSGAYPFVNDFCVAIRKTESADSPARKLFEWLQSAEGQTLVAESGYVPATVTGQEVTGQSGFALAETDGGRYYPDYTDTLIPRGDYGPLYPFIGALTQPMDAEWGTTPMYGLCTADGKIVVDSVYHRVDLLTRADKQILRLSRYRVDISEERYEEQREITYAATDGSWTRTYQREAPDFGGGELAHLMRMPDAEFIPVFDGNGWGAMDYDGNEVYPCKERFPVMFCDGLAVVYSDSGESYRYVNLNGETILGPFDAPEPLGADAYIYDFVIQQVHFSKGLALFNENGLWGYMDTNGAAVIPPQLNDRPSPFYGDYAFTANYEVIGRDGHVIAPVDTEKSYWPESVNEQIFCLYDEDIYFGDARIFMNANGEIVPEPAAAPPEDVYPPNADDFEIITAFNGYFAVKAETYGGLVNAEGEWIVKRSLLDFMRD